MKSESKNFTDFFLRYSAVVPAGETDAHSPLDTGCGCRPRVKFETENGWHTLTHNSLLPGESDRGDGATGYQPEALSEIDFWRAGEDLQNGEIERAVEAIGENENLIEYGSSAVKFYGIETDENPDEMTAKIN